MNDAFYKMIQQIAATYLNVNSYVRSTNDTRRFKLSVSYNFGKIKVQQRKLKSNEDEKARLTH